MDIQDLKIFTRVARVQNLSAVGTEFELSAGTISKRLQALEAELSVRLFDRTTRSISITEEGAKLLGEIESIVRQLDRAFASIDTHVKQPRGRLRILAPTSLARGVMAPAICAFMRAYPEIDVQLDLSDRQFAVADSGYDVAIRTGELEDSSLVAKRLAPDPQVVVASPNYLKRFGVPDRPEDLAGHTCLLLGDGQHWRFIEDGRVIDVKVTGRLRCENADLLRHAALEGCGVLRVSRARVADDIAGGLLEHVLAAFEPASTSAIWAVYPSSRHVLPKLKVFISFMSTWFRDEHGAPATRPGGASSEVQVLLERILRPHEERLP